MTLLVSIHDVAPPFARQVHELWSIALAHGVRPALLVVPDWHGRAPLAGDRTFANWVFARADQGAPIFLHGERHDEVGTTRAPRDHLRAFGRTACEGEFLTLDVAEAQARITRGLQMLSACGVAPIGFVAPAWLARDTTDEAARHAGLQLTEDAATIRHLQTGVVVRSPVIRWSTRARWRMHCSTAVADARWALQRGARFVRLALHPGDADHPATRRSIERTFARWLALRSAMSYATLARVMGEPAAGGSAAPQGTERAA